MLDLARLKWYNNGVGRHVQWKIKRVAARALWSGSSRKIHHHALTIWHAERPNEQHVERGEHVFPEYKRRTLKKITQ
jgi:hypothetical protein